MERRLISQRSSLETLEDIEENAPLRSTCKLILVTSISLCVLAEAAELCLCRGEDGKDRLGKLNTEGLCWSRARAEDAGLGGATEDAAARSSPGCTASTGFIPSACELCLGLHHNGPERNRERFHMRFVSYTVRNTSWRYSRELRTFFFFSLPSLATDLFFRCRTLSGSPRPKNFKKVHFIKNMRQHDTRNGRIVLISSRRSFCSIFSVLPYRDCTQVGDMKLDGGRQCHSTGVCLKEIIGLEGVELGADGKTVSYTQFLFPTNALGTRRNTIDSTSSFSQFRNASHRSLSLGRANSTQGSIDAGSDLGDFVEYDPNLLDDPQWPCGKHKRVLIFPSYMTTVIDYVKPSDLKKDMNETFKEKFPHIKLTLSKIRSLKREMRKLAQEECGFEEPTVAMAFVYFEKLALKGKLNKQNRKLCAGACVLLAAKIGSDLRKHEVKHLIDKLEEKFRLNRRELIAFEFPVLVALEFALHLPEHEVMPHYRRLVQNS
ncbi:hypothetical protein IHE44_0000930 [Lamprotornis superbus]|uniref:Cyclin N-terminal domain-containing protein n=1 Tax=Lamprotornis superbus TaxID=245042 RepID=A0A835TQQ3_9PASS|nr:hypothetical protein IHE44_0000930 [Lamprotornis superbus]